MRDRLSHLFSSDKSFSNKIKLLTGFYPGNLGLYRLAFRHRSTLKDPSLAKEGSNERLEYLGDAVLGAIVAEHLYKLFPFKDEGFLTQLRSKIVSRGKLNLLARKLGLEELLIIDNSVKSKMGSIAGDALEALIGALFIDKGFKHTRVFVLERLIELHLDINELISTENDYKSRLVEWSQKEKKCLEFKLLGEELEGGITQYQIAVFVDGKEVARHSDHSKKKAEQFASEHAFKQMKL